MALGANAFEGSSLAGVPEIKSASRQSTKKQILRMINPAGSCHLEMASVPLLAATLQRRKVRPHCTRMRSTLRKARGGPAAARGTG